MSQRILHQIIAGASPGDAVTDHALLIRGWLREWGFASQIYAEHADAPLEAEVRPALSYRPGRDEAVVIYHHSIGSSVAEQLLRLQQPLILIYHNVTPPAFLTAVDPVRAQHAALGRQQLPLLQPQTRLALAASAYSEGELQEAGFQPTGVLPITLPEATYQVSLNDSLLTRYSKSGLNLLFVGRVAPNKRQEDLIKLLYYLRRIRPEARLFLVGGEFMAAYSNWLQDFASELGLTEAVHFTGRVSQPDLVTYYHLADLYVSMSEHEGFGKPLIESMYFNVPILAYAASAVPETMGGAGILFHRKEYEALAELVDFLLQDDTLRQRLLAAQHKRVQFFLEEQVRKRWRQYLTDLGLF